LVDRKVESTTQECSQEKPMSIPSKLHEPILLTLAMATIMALLTMVVTTRRGFAQVPETTSPLVLRVAVFPADQGTLGDYRSWIDGHLFPTLRTVPGYVGTFLGRDPNGGQLISLSFWQSEAAAAGGEEAVGRVLRSLPADTAPRPSKVEKYVIEYRDLTGSMPR
jgi:hypothetical protein